MLYILPWLFTVAIVAVLWRLLLSPNGVVNYLLGTTGLTDGQTEWLANPSTALAAVTFINIWSGYPFFMISLLAGLQGIPRDLYEAAKVDGAGALAQFRNVTLPQLKPIIISMALLDFIWTTQQFALIWMTTGGGPINSTEVLDLHVQARVHRVRVLGRLRVRGPRAPHVDGSRVLLRAAPEGEGPR